MNTVKIGDKFENKSYNLIIKAIKNGELGISKKYVKVFQKKGYYSKDREKEIIFDLAIEVWPEKAQRYSLLYLIECKSSNSKKVPVDDIEEFYAKINQVAGVNVKGVMISDNSFQDGTIVFAKNKGMMLIEIDESNNHSFVLHKTDKKSSTADEENIDTLLYNFIVKTLGSQKAEGLQKLTKEFIEKEAKKILDDYNEGKKGIEINGFINYLTSKHNLSFDFKSHLETIKGKKIFGYCDIKSRKIFIDPSIVNTERFPFVLGHELGHFFLHRELKINQELYNDSEDSEYDLFSGRHVLNNDKNWIEWQANKFAISLFLPRDLFLYRFLAFRESIGISRFHYIYLDNQPINKQDYHKTLEHLSLFFKISKTAVRHRIEELDLIIYEGGKNDFRSNLRTVVLDNYNNAFSTKYNSNI